MIQRHGEGSEKSATSAILRTKHRRDVSLDRQALQRTYHGRSVRPPAQLQDHPELVASQWQ